jgi:uncharacterized protein (UPF0262 family)
MTAPCASSAILSIDLVSEKGLPKMLAAERETAMADLRRESVFQPVNDHNGPYRILLSTAPKHLVFNVKNSLEVALPSFGISTGPYRRIMRDYFLMIDGYEQSRIDGNRGKLEAIDMGRRGLHDEAAYLMQERLKDRLILDHPTARRFFTLLCALQSGPGQGII